VGVTIKIEVSEIRDRFESSTHPYETSEALNHFDLHEVRRMELLLIAEEAGFDSDAS
jgi:hypothetical protein